MKNPLKYSKYLFFVLFSLFFSKLRATDYSAGRDINDYLGANFNFIVGREQRNPFLAENDDYAELELYGRKGIVDFYGYIDFLDVLNTNHSDSHNSDNFFAELKPRISLDGILKRDLSFAMFKEWYVVYEMKMGGAGENSLYYNYVGIGTDIKVPYLNIVKASLRAIYKTEDYNSSAEGKWDGYSLDLSWFKPVITFKENFFISYQGYLTYDFAATNVNKDAGRSPYEFQWYNGLFVHYRALAAGFGIKFLSNMGYWEDKDKSAGVTQDTSGAAYYLTFSYQL